MAASDLANGVGMIKPKVRHPLLPGQIRRQSLKLPKEALENPGHPRENASVIAGADWVHGQQAARILRLRAGHGLRKKRTRRERFLAEMEKVVPWKVLIDLIETHYSKVNVKLRPNLSHHFRH